MKAERFESTLEFAHFKTVMRGVLSVPKEKLDILVQEAKKDSPRSGDPHAPGRKRMTKRHKPKRQRS
jgi:hypothetical protein